MVQSRFKIVISLLALAFASLACVTIMGKPQTVVVTVEAEASPKVIVVTSTPEPEASEDEIRASIQDALDLLDRAYIENDADLLAQAVDQTMLPFRRLVKTRFQVDQESVFGGGGDFRFYGQRN